MREIFNKKNIFLSLFGETIAVVFVVGILAFGFNGGFALAANVFPTSTNDWGAGDTIESSWANSLEDKIGVTNSTSSDSLDYMLRHPSSTIGSIANEATTSNYILLADGQGWKSVATSSLGYWDNLSDITLAQGRIYIGDATNHPSSTAALYVDTSGHLGIGTTSPAYGLELKASTTKGYFGISNTSQGNIFVIDGSGNIGFNGNISTGTWQGTAIADAYVANDITLTNITQITNRALTDLTGTLAIASTTGILSNTQGGLGQDASGWTGIIRVDSGTFSTTTDDDVPESGDFGNAGDLDADGTLSTDAVQASEIDTVGAGRSLTWDTTNDEMDADAELYTRKPTYNYIPATTTEKYRRLSHTPPGTCTITEIGCWTDIGTSSVAFYEAVPTSPNASSSTIVNKITADTNMASTTSFSDSAIANQNIITGIILDVETASNTWCYVEYTVDD